MRKLALILVGAGAMAIVAVATSFGASPNAGPRDAIWGGGHFSPIIGGTQFQRDISVTAELGRFGDADGTLVYGNNGASSRTDGVTCLAVSGNHAVIGGHDPQQGWPFLYYMVDNGPPSSPTRDQVSPLLLLDPSDVAQMPAGFPSVCPSPDVVFGGFAYSDLSGGDIVVQDVG